MCLHSCCSHASFHTTHTHTLSLSLSLRNRRHHRHSCAQVRPRLQQSHPHALSLPGVWPLCGIKCGNGLQRGGLGRGTQSNSHLDLCIFWLCWEYLSVWAHPFMLSIGLFLVLCMLSSGVFLVRSSMRWQASGMHGFGGVRSSMEQLLLSSVNGCPCGETYSQRDFAKSLRV